MSYKNLLAVALLAFSVQSYGQTSNAAPYCTPVFGTTSCSCGISNVSYGSVNNATVLGANQYTFYNNLPADTIGAGSSFCIAVTAGGANNDLTLFVDWNHDNTFNSGNGPYELVNTQTFGGGGGIIHLCGVVPDTALAGLTRARIMWVNGLLPCQGPVSAPYSGEIEDYQVVIQGAKAIPRVTGATNLTGSTATLQGTVHANGTPPATVDFEYGQTTSYTNSISGGTVSANAHTPVSVSITGLQPNTIYHYHIKSTNTYGSSYSADTTFVTIGSTGIENTLQNILTVAPNPAHGTVYVSGLSTGHNYTAGICDITGRNVFEGSISADGVLHLENLHPGIYFLKVTDVTEKNAQPYMACIVLN